MSFLLTVCRLPVFTLVGTVLYHTMALYLKLEVLVSNLMFPQLELLVLYGWSVGRSAWRGLGIPEVMVLLSETWFARAFS